MTTPSKIKIHLLGETTVGKSLFAQALAEQFEATEAAVDEGAPKDYMSPDPTGYIGFDEIFFDKIKDAPPAVILFDEMPG